VDTNLDLDRQVTDLELIADAADYQRYRERVPMIIPRLGRSG
jgi:protein-S-isoprenylcysteine O-methyltransferase Ste14